MQYSEEFKQKVLSTLGDSEDIKKMLDSGSEWLGRYLDDSSQGGLSPKEVVEACQSMNLQPLYQKAQRKLALQQLYGEWSDMYRNQNSNGMHR